MSSADDFDTNSQLLLNSQGGIIKRSIVESNIRHNINISVDKQAETAMPRKKRVIIKTTINTYNDSPNIAVEASRPELVNDVEEIILRKTVMETLALFQSDSNDNERQNLQTQNG